MTTQGSFRTKVLAEVGAGMETDMIREVDTPEVGAMRTAEGGSSEAMT